MTTVIDNVTGHPLDGDYEHAPEVALLRPIDTSETRRYFEEARAMFPDPGDQGTAMERGSELCERWEVVEARKRRHMAYRQQYQMDAIRGNLKRMRTK